MQCILIYDAENFLSLGWLLIFFQLNLLIGIRVLDNLKDYAVRAVVNAVDHLGTVAYKLTDLFEQQASEVSNIEMKVVRLNQVLLPV
jgi:small basic protein